MEIDVTTYVTTVDCSELSGSVAELGSNAAPYTWSNAMEQADPPLVTSEQQGELREWLQGFGAWDEDEIAAMSDQETNALLIQFIAGDVREMDMYSDVAEYEQAQEKGECSGHLLQGDNDTWWFYVG